MKIISLNFYKLIYPKLLTDDEIEREIRARVREKDGKCYLEYFDKTIMYNNLIVEVNLNNNKYLKFFEYLFDCPSKEEVIEFLISKDRFEDIILINNGASFTNLKRMSERIDDALLEVRKKLL